MRSVFEFIYIYVRVFVCVRERKFCCDVERIYSPFWEALKTILGCGVCRRPVAHQNKRAEKKCAVAEYIWVSLIFNKGYCLT